MYFLILTSKFDKIARFYTFLANYLVISKKSSTFALAFEKEV